MALSDIGPCRYCHRTAPRDRDGYCDRCPPVPSYDWHDEFTAPDMSGLWVILAMLSAVLMIYCILRFGR